MGGEVRRVRVTSAEGGRGGGKNAMVWRARHVLTHSNRRDERLAKMADGKKIRYLNVNDRLADKDGKLFEGISKDRLHPSLKGYQIWAEGLKPIFTEVLGPAAKTDHAPPPTGDPSAKPPKGN